MNKDEKVCYCFNVTVGDIEKAINEGADSLGAVQQATKAGSFIAFSISPTVTLKQ